MTDKQTSSRPTALLPFNFLGSLRPSNSISQQTGVMAHKSASLSAAAQPAKSFNTSSLMSPPELPRYESFSYPTASVPVKTMDSITVANVRRAPVPLQPLSPPISPAARIDDRIPSAELSPTASIKDPILYPTQSASTSPPQPPLFSRDDALDTRRIVDRHVVARPTTFFRQSAPPQREEYELMLYFKSHVMKKYKEDPKGWLRRERAQLLADRKAGARHNQFRLHRILPAKPQVVRPNVQRVVKPAPKPTRTITVTAAPRLIRANPPSAPAPRQPAVRVRKTSPTPDPSRRVVAPNREDKEFELLPDYCPPLSSLPNKSNSLKVDWKGAPIDLGADPYKGLLHPDEVMLAANLRLDCATYLTSKRRMFIRRLECLRVGKEFRKTDAQQACKIDVNKASKLWTAFDKVGWLEKGWISKFA